METLYVLKLSNNFSSGLINRNSSSNNVLLTKKLSHAKTFIKKNKAETFAKKVVEEYHCKVCVDILEVSMEVVS